MTHTQVEIGNFIVDVYFVEVAPNHYSCRYWDITIDGDTATLTNATENHEPVKLSNPNRKGLLKVLSTYIVLESLLRMSAEDFYKTWLDEHE